jgi:hypothetical protein
MLIIKIYEIVYIPPDPSVGLAHKTMYKHMNDVYFRKWRKSVFYKKSVISCKVFKKLSVKFKIEDLKN